MWLPHFKNYLSREETWTDTICKSGFFSPPFFHLIVHVGILNEKYSYLLHDIFEREACGTGQVGNCGLLNCFLLCSSSNWAESLIKDCIIAEIAISCSPPLPLSSAVVAFVVAVVVSFIGGGCGVCGSWGTGWDKVLTMVGAVIFVWTLFGGALKNKRNIVF